MPDPVESTTPPESRNAFVQRRYDELMREGKHGHYETLFRVVNEAVDREAAELRNLLSDAYDFILPFEDVVDYGEGRQGPNRAMSLVREIDTALKRTATDKGVA